MGLFSKITDAFSKKNCDICGGEIGLLGNRKVEDGNMCKHCAAKLSPWFSERKSSNLAEIKEQLRYRQDNQRMLALFTKSRTFGRYKKVIYDSILNQFVVASTDDLEKENPDIIRIQDMVDVDYEIKESRIEQKQTVKDAEGKSKQVSYDPPHYRYSYRFHVTIKVDNPYFDEMSFDLNSGSVNVDTVGSMEMNTTYVRDKNSGIKGAVQRGIEEAMNIQNHGYDPRRANKDYVEYEEMANNLKNFLTGMKNICQIKPNMEGAAAIVEEASQPVNEVVSGPVTCPYCNAETTPDANGCCEYCGSKLK